MKTQDHVVDVKNLNLDEIESIELRSAVTDTIDDNGAIVNRELRYKELTICSKKGTTIEIIASSVSITNGEKLLTKEEIAQFPRYPAGLRCL